MGGQRWTEQDRIDLYFRNASADEIREMMKSINRTLKLRNIRLEPPRKRPAKEAGNPVQPVLEDVHEDRTEEGD